MLTQKHNWTHLHSLCLPCKYVHQYHCSRFHIHALIYCFCFTFFFFFFGFETCGILVTRAGIKPAPPALEGEVLTAGLPGKSQVWGLAFGNLLLLLIYQYRFPDSLLILLVEESSHFCYYLVFWVHLVLHVPQILNITDELLPVLCFV